LAEIGRPQCHKVATLVGISSNLRTILAAHVAFQFVDRGRFRSANDVQGHGLVRIAAKTANLKIEVSGVQGVAKPSGGDGWAGPL
jgi:hypothetical protein